MKAIFEFLDRNISYLRHSGAAGDIPVRHINVTAKDIVPISKIIIRNDILCRWLQPTVRVLIKKTVRAVMFFKAGTIFRTEWRKS